MNVGASDNRTQTSMVLYGGIRAVKDERRKTRQDLTADAVIDWIRDKGTIAEALPWPTCILIEMPQSLPVRAGTTGSNRSRGIMYTKTK